MIQEILLMKKLGFDEFKLVGHDRGARTSHRMCLDFPDKIKKVGIKVAVFE